MVNANGACTCGSIAPRWWSSHPAVCGFIDAEGRGSSALTGGVVWIGLLWVSEYTKRCMMIDYCCTKTYLLLCEPGTLTGREEPYSLADAALAGAGLAQQALQHRDSIKLSVAIKLTLTLGRESRCPTSQAHSTLACYSYSYAAHTPTAGRHRSHTHTPPRRPRRHITVLPSSSTARPTLGLNPAEVS